MEKKQLKRWLRALEIAKYLFEDEGYFTDYLGEIEQLITQTMNESLHDKGVMLMKTIEIFFHDLNQEKQQELMALYQVETPEQMNWNIFPVTVIQEPESAKELVENVLTRGERANDKSKV